MHTAVLITVTSDKVQHWQHLTNVQHMQQVFCLQSKGSDMLAANPSTEETIRASWDSG